MSFPGRLRLNNKLAYYKNQMEVLYSYLRVIDGIAIYQHTNRSDWSISFCRLHFRLLWRTGFITKSRSCSHLHCCSGLFYIDYLDASNFPNFLGLVFVPNSCWLLSCDIFYFNRKLAKCKTNDAE